MYYSIYIIYCIYIYICITYQRRFTLCTMDFKNMVMMECSFFDPQVLQHASTWNHAVQPLQRYFKGIQVQLNASNKNRKKVMEKTSNRSIDVLDALFFSLHKFIIKPNHTQPYFCISPWNFTQGFHMDYLTHGRHMEHGSGALRQGVLRSTDAHAAARAAPPRGGLPGSGHVVCMVLEDELRGRVDNIMYI